MNDNEIWKDILGYEGLYQVSNMGRVKSLYHNKERIIKTRKNNSGYEIVSLYKNKKIKTYSVHRLIVLSFFGKPVNKTYYEVNHIDEDITNNKLENLQYCTHSYNMNYGTCQQRIHDNKFKPIIGINIINGYICVYPSAIEIERSLKIKQESISLCCQGKKKSAGGYIWMYKNE